MKISEDGKKRKVVYVKIKDNNDFYDALNFCFGENDEKHELRKRMRFVYDGEYVVVPSRPLKRGSKYNEDK